MVRIDKLVHQRAKILAAELDIPLSAFVEDAVRARLAKSAVLRRPSIPRTSAQPPQGIETDWAGRQDRSDFPEPQKRP